MHVGGGTGSQVFVYRAAFDWREVTKKLKATGAPKVYLIRRWRTHMMTPRRATLGRLRSQVAKRWQHLIQDAMPLTEDPVPAAELGQSMREASIPSSGFFVMLTLSSAIATLGLLSNSAPAIIGAMIIAPLMSPIMAFAYGTIVCEWRQMGRST